jgi:hypothetical protein
MTTRLVDIAECSSCGQAHKAVHVLKAMAVVWYFCPSTEDRVPFAFEPPELQPA